MKLKDFYIKYHIPDSKLISNQHFYKVSVSFILEDTPTAYANAIRRTLIDDIKGVCMNFESINYKKTTDVFVAEGDLRLQIRNIPIYPFITDDIISSLNMKLHIENNTHDFKTVYAGDIEIVTDTSMKITDMFNPKYRIAYICPGKVLSIDNIKICQGYGYENGSFIICTNVYSIPLGIDEHKNISNPPLNDFSGYTTSSLVSTPTKYKIGFTYRTLPLHKEELAKIAPIRACERICEILNMFNNILHFYMTHRYDEIISTNVTFNVSQDADVYIMKLFIDGEYETYGNLIINAINLKDPDINRVHYNYISYKNQLRILVAKKTKNEKELTKFVYDIIKSLIDIYTDLVHQFDANPVL